MNQILVNEKVIVTPEFRRKKKVYKFNFFLSVFLVCTLFSCYIYAEYDRNKSEEVSQQILLSLEDTAEEIENTEDTTTISVEEDVIVVKLLANNNENEEENIVNITDIVNNNSNNESNNSNDNSSAQPQQQSKIVESVSDSGKSYYTEAILKIPKIGIEYPVLSDTSDELLKISVNKLHGPDPNEVGNYVIVGHNYKSGKMFGKLSQMAIGDTFELKDTSNRTITYKIYDIYTVEPTDVKCTSQLTGGKKEVTLITCKNSGKQRLIVKAREIEN